MGGFRRKVGSVGDAATANALESIAKDELIAALRAQVANLEVALAEAKAEVSDAMRIEREACAALAGSFGYSGAGAIAAAIRARR